MNHHLRNDCLLFHPVHTQTRAIGPRSLHHTKGRGLAVRHNGVALVADEQDALALLLAQLVRDQAVTPLPAIEASAITSKGLPPAFEYAQPDADLAAALTRPAPAE